MGAQHVTLKKSVAKTSEVTKAVREKTPTPRRTMAVVQEKTVLVDPRSGKDRRNQTDRRQKSIPVAVERRTGERRAKVNRRRQIDPTTCERDYTPDEIEFMQAMDEYKRRNGRMFPTCSEILEVVRDLGYAKQSLAVGVSAFPELSNPPTSTQQAV
jgi:hypothetical protein